MELLICRWDFDAFWTRRRKFKHFFLVHRWNFCLFLEIRKMIAYGLNMKQQYLSFPSETLSYLNKTYLDKYLPEISQRCSEEVKRIKNLMKGIEEKCISFLWSIHNNRTILCSLSFYFISQMRFILIMLQNSIFL